MPINQGIVNDTQTWACRPNGRRQNCQAQPYRPGQPGHTCGETRVARWQCAISYLMEMLYHRILDGGLARTIVIPEAVDYRALVLAIGDAMFSDTMRKYPNPSDWPDDERRGRNSTGGRIHKHAANLQMKEPWHVYNNLEEWMHALFVYYAPIGQSPPPRGTIPLCWATR